MSTVVVPDENEDRRVLIVFIRIMINDTVIQYFLPPEKEVCNCTTFVGSLLRPRIYYHTHHFSDVILVICRGVVAYEEVFVSTVQYLFTY